MLLIAVFSLLEVQHQIVRRRKNRPVQSSLLARIRLNAHGEGQIFGNLSYFQQKLVSMVRLSVSKFYLGLVILCEQGQSLSAGN